MFPCAIPWPCPSVIAHQQILTHPLAEQTNQKRTHILKIIIWTKRLLLTFTFLALITTNIFTLTNTAFNAALSGLMGTALGVRTVSSMMQAKLASQDKVIKKQAAVQAKRKAATRKFGTSLTVAKSFL
jgi:hypothetical protein